MRSTTQMSRLMVFFRTFHQPRKSARVAAHSSAELGAHSSTSTLSAHQMAPHESGPVTTWVDDNGDAWTLVYSALGMHWLTRCTPSGSRGGASKSVHRPWVLQFLDTVVGGSVVLVVYEGRGRIPHISFVALDSGHFSTSPLCLAVTRLGALTSVCSCF